MCGSRGRKRKPVIGVCASYHLNNGKTPGIVDISAAYVDAVEKAGGVPILLVPTIAPELAVELVDRIDALLLPGGGDIMPSHYGQRKCRSHKPLHPRRETFWFQALAEAEQRRIPVLGICLGSQVMSVHRGGTLIQDVPTQWKDPLKHQSGEGETQRMHTVIVEPGTLLASIIGHGLSKRNTSHHQAIEKPGNGLSISARAPDGIIEAVEDPDYPFYLALQWHPERIRNTKHRGKIFEAFIEAAKKYREEETGNRPPPLF